MKVRKLAGYLLYLRESTLMAQPFDRERVVTGDAMPVAEKVGHIYSLAGHLESFPPLRTAC